MPRPVRANYSIPYGAQFGAPRAGGTRRHNGTDYHAPPGTPIYGVADGGRVAHIGYNGDAWLGLGHNITIVYPGGVQTLDGHMLNRTPLQYGQTVNSNTVIGYVGNTGNAVNSDPKGPYNGNHDHHERRHNGVLVDPEAVYRNEPAGGNPTPIEEENMTTYELWRTGTSSQTVWFVVDRLFRYGIPNETALSDYAAFIRSKGQDATIRLGAAGSLGLPVYRDGVTVAPSDRLTQAQVTGAVRAALADFDSTTVEIDEEALAANIAAAIQIPTTITGTLS